MEHDCSHQERIIEMSGDIKTLLSEFKAMNGTLRDTKIKFEKHDSVSDLFRKKVDVMWYGSRIVAWIVLVLVGCGWLFKWLTK